MLIIFFFPLSFEEQLEAPVPAEDGTGGFPLPRRCVLGFGGTSWLKAMHLPLGMSSLSSQTAGAQAAAAQLHANSLRNEIQLLVGLLNEPRACIRSIFSTAVGVYSNKKATRAWLLQEFFYMLVQYSAAVWMRVVEFWMGHWAET